MTRNYLLLEKDSYVSFAVISNIDDTRLLGNIDLMNKVGQAIDEQYCLEEKSKINWVKYMEDCLANGGENKERIILEFSNVDDMGDEEVREFELNIVAIY